MRADRSFDEIATAFVNNVESVRVLANEIARLADAHDRARAHNVLADVLSWAGVSRQVVDDFRSTLASLNVDIDINLNKPVQNDLDPDAAKIKEALQKVVRDNPGKIVDLQRIMREARKASARQGQLLRRGAITLLVSFFDTLLSDLVHAYYLRFPDALPAEANSLSLAELRRLGTVADAEVVIASKESERLLRENLEEQLKFFSTRLKYQFDKLSSATVMFEVSQRRNVIVHNNAIVNRIYLDRAPKALTERYGLTDGAELQNSPEYLDEAIATTLALGCALVQHAWRKWGKEPEAADSFAVRQIYDLLLDEQYRDANDIGEMLHTIDVSSDEYRRMLTINRAIALCRLGRIGDAERELDSLDWSATSLRFRVTVAAIKGDTLTFDELAPRALSAGEIQKHEFEQWPAFKPLHLHPGFRILVGWDVDNETPPASG